MTCLGFWSSKDTAEPVRGLDHQPVLGLVLQGAKETSVGARSVSIEAGEALLVKP
ncbi:AraC family transcriptional regulator N-terminal domain-containing protein [Caulobacter segnis]